jgi:hypothetical protein
VKHLRPLALVFLCLLLACTKQTIEEPSAIKPSAQGSVGASKQKDIPPQNWRGYEVKVLSVEAKSTPYKMKKFNLECTAKEGSEVIVAEVAFKSQDVTGLGVIVRARLEDMAGKRYEILNLATPEPESASNASEFCFEVPKGAKLKTLRIEDLTFDLK